MNTQAADPIILSESDIEYIIADIEEAKQDAINLARQNEVGNKFACFNGSLSVILHRIDKRIGDAVWME